MRAHTDNDSIVCIPERRVLFTGDLAFNGGTPFLLQGSVTGARRTSSGCSRSNRRSWSPGTATSVDPRFSSSADYLDVVLDTARAGMAAGLTPLETARESDLGAFADLLDSERIVGNLHRAYADLQERTDLDLAAALRDMITLNGGPLTTHA